MTLLISLLLYFTWSLLLSRFLDIISFFSEKKERYLFEIDNFHGIFGTGLISKSLEAVVSLGGMSEGNQLLRLLIEGFAELGNTFSQLVREIEGTQIGAIFGGAVSVEVVVSLLSETEKKYSGILLRLEE